MLRLVCTIKMLQNAFKRLKRNKTLLQNLKRQESMKTQNKSFQKKRSRLESDFWDLSPQAWVSTMYQMHRSLLEFVKKNLAN